MAGGPLGVRFSIWFSVSGMTLVCLLLSVRHSEPPHAETASTEVSVQKSRYYWLSHRARRTAQAEVNGGQTNSVENDAGQIDFAKVQQLIQDRGTWRDEPTWRVGFRVR